MDKLTVISHNIPCVLFNFGTNFVLTDNASQSITIFGFWMEKGQIGPSNEAIDNQLPTMLTLETTNMNPRGMCIMVMHFVC